MDELNFGALAVFMGIFSVVATVFNLALMFTILRERNLRRSSKHILIIAMCYCDFITGVFECPLSAEAYAKREWTHSCLTSNFLYMIIPRWLLLTRLSLTVSLCVDYLFRLFTNNQRLLKVFAGTMITGAVLVGLMSCIPFFLEMKLNPAYCVQYTSRVQALATMDMFPLLIAILVFVANIILCYSYLQVDVSQIRPEGLGLFPKDIIISSVLMVIFHFPVLIAVFASSACDLRSCDRDHYLYTQLILVHIQYLRPCLMPFLWLLCPDTRMAVKKVLFWRCCSVEREEVHGQPSNVQNWDTLEFSHRQILN